jgi:uncharacterized protein (TIGR00290 family)
MLQDISIPRPCRLRSTLGNLDLRIEDMGTSRDGRYAVLWSGGKDSCLALWRACHSGIRVRTLLNFVDQRSRRVRFHAVRAELIAEQARALDLKLEQHETAANDYASVVGDALKALKARGYDGIVAGDIHLERVRHWNQQQTARVGLELLEPLWHADARQLLTSFVSAGFRAVLTCCDNKWPDTLRIGREIDKHFVSEVLRNSQFDACGENGEYHSFVFDGPLFSRPVQWAPGEFRRSNGFTQVDLVPLSESVRSLKGTKSPTVE